jgi:cation diffusion facilitator CzcD-associated flavoprotein CzcO
MTTTSNDTTGRVVVVGGGIGGMAAALHLRAKGLEVVLVEKNALRHGIP